MLLHFLFHVNYNTYEHLIRHTLPHWERSDLKSNLNRKVTDMRNKRLRHHTSDALIKRLCYRVSSTQFNLQVKLNIVLVSSSCSLFSKHAELSRTSKLALPLSLTFSNGVTLNVMHNNTRSIQIKVLVMLDSEYEMLWLHQLREDNARIEFQVYHWRFVYYLEASIFTISHRWSNIIFSCMHNKLVMFAL